MKTLRILTFLAPLLCASCASDKPATKTSASASSTPALRPLSQRIEEKNGYKQDADGNWVPQNDKRSSFENKGEAAYFKKDFKKQEYKAGEYTKKSWWGNKDYDRKSYAGNTDGSRFQNTSSLADKSAREGGSTAKIPDPYQTTNYATSGAREASKTDLAKPSNDLIENRRNSYQPPEVIDWREQRTLSMDQSKRILGR